MKTTKLLLVMLFSITVAACIDRVDPTPARTLGGAAAVGYPIVNGTIQVKCAGGSALTDTTTSAGAWKVTISGQTLPCAVEVSSGTINGVANSTPYHSIATSFGTVNVTPLTDLMVANLAGTAATDVWFAGLTPAALALITPTLVNTALTNLSTALSGLTPLSTINPITTAFTPTSGNTSDNMLVALKTAMTNTGVSYTTLLGSASTASFTLPTGFGTALTSAYAGTQSGGGGGSGTAAQYFTKNAVGNTWSRLLSYDNSTATDVSTITAVTGGVVTFSYTSNGVNLYSAVGPSVTAPGVYSPWMSHTSQIDGTGALVETDSTGTTIILPAAFSVGTTWVARPATVYGAWYAKVVAFNVTRTVPAGTFTDCLQIKRTMIWLDTTNGVTYTDHYTYYLSPTAGYFVDESGSTTSGSGASLSMTQTWTRQLQGGYVANP